MTNYFQPSEFLAASKDFGPLGLTIARISRYEHALDGFVWAVVEFCPKLPRSFSPRPPHSFDDKLNFLRYCLLSIPHLRRVPMYDDGSVNFTAIFLMAEEINELRKFLAHGAIYSTSSVEERISSYTLTKWKREKLSASEEQLCVGIVTLDAIGQHAEALGELLSTYKSVLSGKLDIETEEKKQREIRDNRKLLDEAGLLPDGFTVDMKELNIRLVNNENKNG